MQEQTNGHNTIVVSAGQGQLAGAVLPRPVVRKRRTAKESLQETFQKVERAKQEWESAVDSLPELICVTDHQGKVVRANYTVEHWNLGKLDSIQGREFHELIHPGCGSKGCYLDSFIKQALKMNLAGRPARLETYDNWLNRHLLVKVHPVEDTKGSKRRTSAIVVHDVTERKQMEKSLRSYTNRLEVMNQIGEAILAATSPQEIARAASSGLRQLVPFQRALLTLCNSRTTDVLVIDIYAEGEKYTQREEWIPWEAFTHEENRDPIRVVEINDISALSSPSYLELQLLGKGMHSYLSIPLIAQDMFIGALILGAEEPGGFAEEDIEIVKEVADSLAIANHQAGLKYQLEQTNTSLEKALQAREEMMQNVSHELRTPLGIIGGYASLINEEAFGAVTNEQVEAINIVLGRVSQLEFLVTRLLTLQAIDKDSLQISLMNLESLFKSMLESWRLRAQNQNVRLSFKAITKLPEFMADEDQLNLAIGTLLDNAIKFSPRGGKLAIRAWAEGQELYITVKDQGIGIPAEKIDRIFERFVQADGGSTRRYGGMGIGLALCHDIIKAHDGRIWAESEGKDKGSKFTIVLPIDEGLLR